MPSSVLTFLQLKVHTGCIQGFMLCGHVHPVSDLSVHSYAEGGATEAYCNRAVSQSVCLLKYLLVAH